jgi:hypothetical protein
VLRLALGAVVAIVVAGTRDRVAMRATFGSVYAIREPRE